MASKWCLSLGKLKLLSNMYSSDFWHKFWAGAICYMDLLPETVKKNVSSTFADSFKNFPSGSTAKAIRALWWPLECPKRQFRAFPGDARSWKVVRLRYCSAVDNFFSYCFAIGDNLTRLLSPRKLLQKLVYYYLSAFSDCPCDLEVALEI